MMEIGALEKGYILLGADQQMGDLEKSLFLGKHMNWSEAVLELADRRRWEKQPRLVILDYWI